MAHTDAGMAHGVLMVIAWIFLSEFAEVIGWYASNKVCARCRGRLLTRVAPFTSQSRAV
jgi:hypothetical protein